MIRNKIRSKAFLIVGILLVAASVFFLTVSAANNGWYVKRERDHRQPRLDVGQEIIRDYDAYYIDLRHGDGDSERVIYLTFDAGYINENVLSILDTLKKERVPAAFFVLEHLLTNEGETVKRMVADGHLVCNHTMKHKDATRLGKDAFRAELLGLEESYKKLIGRDMPKYYRPPEGKYNKQTLSWAKELGYKTIFWSFAYADWDNGKQPELERARKKIEENIHNGAVLLLHPTSKTNAALLPELIRALKTEGYRFGTLDELTAK